MESTEMTGTDHSTRATDGASLPALVFNGQVIHDRNEMLSLTDMWKAAGSPGNREPFNWARKEGAAFVEAVTVSLNLPEGQVLTKRQGRNGGTWGHWQIALGYAKYLDHGFHMWTNTVVRDRMEQASHPVLPADISAKIERTNSIARDLSHRVKVLQEAVTELQEKRATPALDFGGTVSAHQMIEMAGIEAKRRQRGTAQMVTNRMLAFCAQHRIACIRTPAVVNPSEPYRFPHSIACDWLLGETKGAEVIRSQIERARAKKARRGAATGQTAFQLVPAASPLHR
jgi:hypothetical protein